MEETGKKKLTKKQIMALVVVWLMVLCVLLIVVLLVFQIRTIKVEGNKYSSVQDINEWLQADELSTNALYLMGKFYLTDFELLPTMEDAEMRMVNPWTIEVDIKEKSVVGYIAAGDDCIYFDEDGCVLAITPEWWDDIPAVEGIELDEVTLYEELPVSKADKKALKNLIGISEILAKYDLVASRLEVRDGEINLYFGNKCVILGNENIENRIAQIPPILEKLGDQKGTLHLENYDSENEIISFEKDVLPSDLDLDDGATDTATE